MPDYREVNKALWNERARPHAESAGYDLASFLNDPTHLSGSIRFDLPRRCLITLAPMSRQT
jgi:hypothetical protein